MYIYGPPRSVRGWQFGSAVSNPKIDFRSFDFQNFNFRSFDFFNFDLSRLHFPKIRFSNLRFSRIRKTIFKITMFKNSIRKKEANGSAHDWHEIMGRNAWDSFVSFSFQCLPKVSFSRVCWFVFRVPSCSLLLCSVVFSCVQLCSVCLFFESIWMCMYLVRREVCKPAPNTLASKFASFL